MISTHALREEGDMASEGTVTAEVVFLPTPSARRATVQHARQQITDDISTHALREEGD